jgi:hypothetical protein
MEASQNKLIVIPVGYSSSQREEIGEDILRFIRTRTEQGLDVNNNSFAAYSKEYEKTGETVDLRFGGNMLADLEVISHGPGFIKIGFTNQESNDKAAWIQSPRGEKLGKQPRREFVGIALSDLNSILENYPL